ncbi:MAG: phosphoribosylanthranilate isomerase [Bacillota bacterium]|nr:phosphoribosylanthranilate isomerase [Bacillota bacterium]MDW7684588.1 phosphoribosylanthranilate isomerase [Bacillota bacterium]
MTRVKICGVKTVEDALFCVKAGADAIGLVFAKSPRQVSLDTARRITDALPPFISRIGVFVDTNRDEVERIARFCGLTTLQFHGSEDAGYCSSFAIPVLKAVQVRSAVDLEGLSEFPAAAFVLDAYHPQIAGGTGRTFDWTLVRTQASRPFVLAGGLTADNVTEAVGLVRPYAVDVSSGVETDGKKDRKKISAFIQAVRRCA